MNTNQLTGLIAIYNDTVLNARFSFAVNTKKNKVTYTITCYWKKRNIRGECSFNDYKDAALYFEGLPAISKIEMV
jgi:hypothetical protein